jgi:hypothetical protein
MEADRDTFKERLIKRVPRFAAWIAVCAGVILWLLVMLPWTMAVPADAQARFMFTLFFYFFPFGIGVYFLFMFLDKWARTRLDTMRQNRLRDELAKKVRLRLRAIHCESKEIDELLAWYGPYRLGLFLRLDRHSPWSILALECGDGVRSWFRGRETSAEINSSGSFDEFVKSLKNVLENIRQQCEGYWDIEYEETPDGGSNYVDSDGIPKTRRVWVDDAHARQRREEVERLLSQLETVNLHRVAVATHRLTRK